MTTHHELEIKYLCELCGRGFVHLSRLKSHIMDHGGPHGGGRRKKPKVQSVVPVEFGDNYFQTN